jgi:hypothetical protein
MGGHAKRRRSLEGDKIDKIRDKRRETNIGDKNKRNWRNLRQYYTTLIIKV